MALRLLFPWCSSITLYIYIYILIIYFHILFLCKDKKGQTIQIQYDDPWSVMLKYRLAKQMELRGVGMWCLDSLDYTNADWSRRFRADMFATFDAFLEEN